jgi:hypothetical protein
MIRATSAALYGSGTPIDLSRVGASRAPRAYGLRSGSSVTGYYAAYGARPNKRRESVNPITNLIEPISMNDDYVPRVITGPSLVTDGIVPTIRMGEWN